MLSQLHIKNLAIVATLEADLQPGLTVLTGETGAGKSILIDALGLVLGDRADNGMIRSDQERAEISAIFDISGYDKARKWLREQALDADDDCILRRVLDRKSGSRAFINDTPVQLKTVQALGAMLVEIHGQHAHQSLLQREQQRRLLDDYGQLQALAADTAESYAVWHRAEQQLEALRTSAGERSGRLELLRYQRTELEALELERDELATLDQDQRRLSNASLLLQQCGTLLHELEDAEQSIQSRLNLATRRLDELLAIDPGPSECAEMLETSSIQLQEAGIALRHYADGIELDPQRLEQVEQRLSDIHDLARKYRCRPEELPRQLETIDLELVQLEQAGTRLAELETSLQSLHQSYLGKAAELSDLRRAAAARLQQSVTEGIRTLDMPHGELLIDIQTLPTEKASAHGLDRIEFQISANPGHPPKPLAKVASGGELSRISLAIQVATIRCAQVPTLIFDEVDVGIGGGVAEIVGRLLRQLGEERQALCVTHLPQVAALGHHHLLINKRTLKGSVTTGIEVLEDEARTREIARMLGGVEITANTLTHAGEMLGR